MTESDVERNLGEQPVARILADAGLKHHDVVAASRVPMTHKMVARACKGRRLTSNTREIVLKAVQAATGKTFRQDELFNYV
ncbi:MAG: hypothetical protein LBW77_06440 [Verrucomicrobiota bacterium]|jgi:hypothetical protein|nr:hypothetical protein [Verrucomicrobiota bacterium]